jgi:hypothetical protein
MLIPKIAWKTMLINSVVPLLIALIPFAPHIYEIFTRPEFHFIYETRYRKNPVIELNRQLDRFVSGLSSLPKLGGGPLPKELVLRLFRDIAEALPAMLADNEFKPMDSQTVEILNVSQYDLRNIKVHFVGCIGFDSYKTYPDSLGSPENRNISPSATSVTVTVRYDNLAHSPEGSSRRAFITFYGADASQCKPTVEAQLANGDLAVGKEDIGRYFDDVDAARWKRERLFDTAVKVFLVVAIVYLYFQIRGLKRRVRNIG